MPRKSKLCVLSCASSAIHIVEVPTVDPRLSCHNKTRPWKMNEMARLVNYQANSIYNVSTLGKCNTFFFSND